MLLPILYLHAQASESLIVQLPLSKHTYLKIIVSENISIELSLLFEAFPYIAALLILCLRIIFNILLKCEVY